MRTVDELLEDVEATLVEVCEDGYPLEHIPMLMEVAKVQVALASVLLQRDMTRKAMEVVEASLADA